jgi:hypothetical protein
MNKLDALPPLQDTATRQKPYRPKFELDYVGGEQVVPHEIIYSTGLSLRVNLMGAIILEPFYAVPIRENSKGVWGLNLLMGGW